METKSTVPTMTDNEYMDMMHVVTVRGRSRSLTGSLCGAALLQWIVEVVKDQVADQLLAEEEAVCGPALKQVSSDAFVKLKLGFAESMTMLNGHEISLALDALEDKKLIVVNWPEEAPPDPGERYGHCWVRLNIERMRELDEEMFGEE